MSIFAQESAEITCYTSLRIIFDQLWIDFSFQCGET